MANIQLACKKIIQHKKAQLEVVALAFLVAGVVTVSSLALLSIGGGTAARSDFVKNFITLENDLNGAEFFYSDMINLAARNALQESGRDLNNFCPYYLDLGPDLQNSIIQKSEDLISQYKNYKGQELPHMKIDGGSTGQLTLEVSVDVVPYLIIIAKPVKKLQVTNSGVKITSNNLIETKIIATATAKPNLEVISLKFVDSSGNEVNEVQNGTTVDVVAKIKNAGCAPANSVSYELKKDGTTVSEETFPTLWIKEIKYAFTADQTGAYTFTAQLSMSGEETNQNDNMGTATINVTD